VLVVDVLSYRVKVQHGKVGDHRPLVTGLDGKDVTEVGSDSVLV